MPRISMYSGPLGVGTLAQPPVPPNNQQLVSNLATKLGTLAYNGYQAANGGVAGQPAVTYPDDPSLSTPTPSVASTPPAPTQGDGPPTATQSASPTAAESATPVAATAAPTPLTAQQGPSLGQTMGKFAMGALFGTGVNPQRGAEAQKAMFDLRAQRDAIARGNAAAGEMTSVMSNATAQMKATPDPTQQHAILADAITQASLIGQKYQVPPSQFTNGFTQWLNVNDPTGSLAAAFMNGSSGKPQDASTFYNEGQRQGEAQTASNLEAQKGQQSYRQAMDVQGLTNTGAADVANISGGYGVKEAGIHAGAEIQSAGIGAGATVAAAKLHEQGESGRTQMQLNTEAPLRTAQASQANAATQDSVTNVMTKLVAGSGIPAQDVPAVVSRATRYAADGAPTAQAVAKAVSDLHPSINSYLTADTMAPYVSPKAAALAQPGQPRVRTYNPATGQIQ